MDENVQVKIDNLIEESDNPVGERFDTTYDVYLPSGVVMPEPSMEDAMHTVRRFRVKYPTGSMKVVRKEIWTRETTVYVDG